MWGTVSANHISSACLSTSESNTLSRVVTNAVDAAHDPSALQRHSF